MFEPLRVDGIFCSDACKQQAYRDRLNGIVDKPKRPERVTLPPKPQCTYITRSGRRCERSATFMTAGDERCTQHERAREIDAIFDYEPSPAQVEDRDAREHRRERRRIKRAERREKQAKREARYAPEPLPDLSDLTR